MKKFFEEFKAFAMRGNVVDMAIGVIIGGAFGKITTSLVTKGLIEEVGRKEALGRPILYGTTDAFLRHFCISSVSELPEIDFSKLAAKLDAKNDAEQELPEHETAVDSMG